MDSVLINVVGRISLQPPNLHRVAFSVQDHAGSLAQHRRRTHSGATGPENVRTQDGASRAGQVAVNDLFDERRYINSRGARLNAWRVKTKQAPVGFNYGFLRSVWRRNLGHVGRRRLWSQLWTDWHKYF